MQGQPLGLLDGPQGTSRRQSGLPELAIQRIILRLYQIYFRQFKGSCFQGSQNQVGSEGPSQKNTVILRL